MFISVNQLANELPKHKPDNFAANALQEGLGGQFGIFTQRFVTVINLRYDKRSIHTEARTAR